MRINPSQPLIVLIGLVAAILTIVIGFIDHPTLLSIAVGATLLAMGSYVTVSWLHDHRELSLFKRVLAEASIRPGTEFTERLSIVHYVGADGQGDREVRHFDTTVAPASTVTWRAFSVFTGFRSVVGRTPARVTARTTQTGASLTLLAIGKPAAPEWRCLVVFSPPVEGRTVTWEVEVRGTYAWENLRKNGVDDLSFGQNLEGHVELFIRIVLPPSLSVPLVRTAPLHGDVQAETFGGADSLVWTLSPAPRGEYRLSIGASPS